MKCMPTMIYQEQCMNKRNKYMEREKVYLPITTTLDSSCSGRVAILPLRVHKVLGSRHIRVTPNEVNRDSLD